MEPSVTPVAENTTSPDTRSMQAVFAVEILDAPFGGAGAFVVVAEHQPRLHLAADAAQRRRRQHAFGRAALADINVDAGGGIGGCDHARHIAVGDQLHRRAGLADLGDQLLRGAAGPSPAR